VSDEISASPITAPHEVISLECSSNDGSPLAQGGFCDSIAQSINDLIRRDSSVPLPAVDG
jgi:hypothetical protein